MYQVKSFSIFVVNDASNIKLLAFMSTKCPLCGKNKTDHSLFCTDCTEKLNSEYEVDVPTSEKSLNNLNVDNEETSDESIALTNEDKLEDNTEIITEEDEQVERSKVAPTTSFDKRAWKKQREDKRTDSEKSYYELSKEGKSNKVIATIIFIVVLILAIAAGLYLYNNNVRSGNLERSKWEMAERENTIDGYLTYMDEYPQGEFSEDAYNNMIELSNRESYMFESLTTSEDISEFEDFLAQYPQSPFERKVKTRFDSLMWESSLKENSAEAYSNYINKVALQEIYGDYIGKAEKRFKMLNQSTPVDEEVLEQIKTTVDGFFVGISTISHTKLSEHLTPVVVKYNNQSNLSIEQITGLLLLQASKEGVESLRLEPELSKIKYELMGNGNYDVNVPIKKIFESNGGTISEIKGYIVHLKMSHLFKVFSYQETKPYTEAP